MLLDLLKSVAGKLARDGAVHGTFPTPPAAGRSAAAVSVGDDDASRRAQALYGAGEMETARPLYEELLRRDPDNPDVAYQLGIIYGRTGHLQAAGALLERVIARRPDSIDALNALANVAWLQYRWRDAEQLFRRALEIQPATVALWANLGLCLHDAGNLDLAAQALRRALEIDPGHPDALLNSALVDIDVGQLDAGEAILQKALQIDPGFAEAHVLLAQLRLQRGDFGAGWPAYEWRFRCADAQLRRDDALAPWDGHADVKRNLVIYAEQGLGDQIMFTSCLPDAIARTGHCVVECDPRLTGLFARSFPQATFFSRDPKSGKGSAEVGARPDCQTHFGSLPGLFRKQWADFPRHEGYLKPDPARVAYWRERLAGLGAGLKIGISWRGGVPRTRHALRSIPLREWLPLLALKGYDFVSLQYGECRDEIAELASRSGIELPHWQEALDNYSETAALVGALDLVISVCTSVVHLAGALGKCAWVLVPVCPEWRYLSAGDRMPWYPAVRLFRQQALGQWEPVIATVRDRLTMAAAAQPGEIEISR